MHKDYKFGKKNEMLLFNILKNKFDDKLKFSDSKYSIFDYYSDDFYIELKSRKCNITDYKSTMVSKNKFDFAESMKDKQFIFVFKFINDDIYYWIYNNDDINNGMVKFSIGGRNDRNKDEYKDYAFINNEILKKI